MRPPQSTSKRTLRMVLVPDLDQVEKYVQAVVVRVLQSARAFKR